MIPSLLVKGVPEYPANSVYFTGWERTTAIRIHYAAVKRGTPVYSSDGHQVGVIDKVVDNYRERILDGFVIEDPSGELRFVDAPEVARTAERAVRLTIDSAAAAQLPAAREGRS